jgi:hypothetical protein
MNLSKGERDDLIPWGLLSYEERSILKQIETGWISLLGDPHVKEAELHRFMGEHAGLFFGQGAVVISRFELGSDYQIDFVVATDEASCGIDFNLIEIELPQTPPYTRSGNPSARLSHAIQQILDWKTWIKRYRGHVRRFFPSTYHGWEEFTNFSYTIFIGRRISSSLAAKRNELAREVGIEIRSFDYLTHRLRQTTSYVSDATFASDGGRPDLRTRNRLANPFAQAYTWQTWKEMVSQPHFACHHFIPKNSGRLLARRTYSKEFGTFLGWWEALPPRKRLFHISRLVRRE